MNAGILNEIVEIYEPNISIDEFGNQHTDYIKKYETRASVSHKSGNRETTNNEVVYVYSKEFRFRIYVPINDFDLVKYNDKFWRINQIEKDKPKQQIIVQTELVND